MHIILTEKSEEGRFVADRGQSVFALHKEIAQFARRRPVLSGHHVDPVVIGGRYLSYQPAIYRLEASL